MHKGTLCNHEFRLVNLLDMVYTTGARIYYHFNVNMVHIMCISTLWATMSSGSSIFYIWCTLSVHESTITLIKYGAHHVQIEQPWVQARQPSTYSVHYRCTNLLSFYANMVHIMCIRALCVTMSSGSSPFYTRFTLQVHEFTIILM